MKVSLENIGKRYNRDWILKSINERFEENTKCSILGGNGSGKSTLLQIISGYLTPSSGEILWYKQSKNLGIDKVYSHVAMASPAMSLYDDFTLQENISFFLKFKSFRNQLTTQDALGLLELEKHRDKQLKHFSSGMKQRVKLGLAILADTSLLLLDEPTSHLDSKATKWYQDLLSENISNRSLFIASNSHPEEVFICTRQVIVEDYK